MGPGLKVLKSFQNLRLVVKLLCPGGKEKFQAPGGRDGSAAVNSWNPEPVTATRYRFSVSRVCSQENKSAVVVDKELTCGPTPH